jgi:hemolysin activation/secretion protein
VLPVRGGTKGEVSWERSGDPLTSDFDYGRLRASAHTLQRLGPRLDLRARALLGSTREGALPPQTVWYLGGIGTLRGHEFKEFAGDQFFLLNAEQYCRIRKRSLFVFAFLDCGAAWFGSGNWDRQRPALDGGVGIRLGEGPLSLHVARDLRDGAAPVLCGVRLGGSF